MRLTIATLLLLLAVAACGDSPATTEVSDERFIEVVVQLRRAAMETMGSPDGFEARRDAVLRDAGVTEEQLRAYVETRGRDLDRMAEIWETINTRLGPGDVEE